MSLKNLIITTGDISDVDGFIALAEYAKTGSDVLFIMNYPAYLYYPDDDTQKDKEYDNKYSGFTYGFKTFFEYQQEQYRTNKTDEKNIKENDFLKIFGIDYDNEYKYQYKLNYIKALTVLAANMCLKVFSQAKMPKGTLYFMIGGINNKNPFNYKFVKNEINVYKSCFDTIKLDIIDYKKIDDCFQFDIYNDKYQLDYNKDYQIFTLKELRLPPPKKAIYNKTNYENFYIDKNGSAAFFNEKQFDKIVQKDKIRGFYIMGGVLADVEPYTANIIPNRVHRPSFATMNQLYHSYNTKLLFDYLKTVPFYVVPNHTILIDNNLLENTNIFGGNTTNFLYKIAYEYYVNKKNAKKPFDYITALLLIKDLTGNLDKDFTESYIYYDNYFGGTIIAKENNLEKDVLFSKTIFELDETYGFYEINKLNFEEYKKKEVIKFQIYPAYVVTIKNDSDISLYKDGKNGKITYQDNYEPVIKNYQDIIELYKPQAIAGGFYKSKRRVLKVY